MSLLQLASDSTAQYPTVASILRKESYVDDILSGGFSIDEAINSLNLLREVLNSAGFPLKKITANNTNLLSHLPPEDLYDLNFLRFHENSSTETLGIKWNAIKDCFAYTPLSINAHFTKRQILSTIAQLFDPVGWITPVTIRAKMLMQQLWLEGIGWDETVSQDSQEKWNNILLDFCHIELISIPRWTQYMPSDHMELHGFCDASKGAYCATVYTLCRCENSRNISNLLVAKSKVAPIKTISLPKLELMGALLLSKLIKYVMTIFNCNNIPITLWSDSSIV